RALVGIYARLAATYALITGHPPARLPNTVASPYADAHALRADLVALAHSLAAHGAGLLDSSGALGRLIRLVEACGFHLATIDLRQNSDVHERVVAELLRIAGVEADYAQLDEPARVALLRRELASPRLLWTEYAQYGEECASELAIVREAAAAPARYSTDRITPALISKPECGSHQLEVNPL